MSNLIAWDAANGVPVEPEREPEHLEYAKYPNGMIRQYRDPSTRPPAPAPEAIRLIHSWAMRERFTDDEEATIVDGDNTKAKIAISRLINRTKGINLDSNKLTRGVDNILAYLDSLNAIDGGKSVADRKVELLQDGNEDEAFS